MSNIVYNGSNHLSKDIGMTFGSDKVYKYSTDKTSVGSIPITDKEYHDIIRLDLKGSGVKRYMHANGIFKRAPIK